MFGKRKTDKKIHYVIRLFFEAGEATLCCKSEQDLNEKFDKLKELIVDCELSKGNFVFFENAAYNLSRIEVIKKDKIFG